MNILNIFKRAAKGSAPKREEALEKISAILPQEIYRSNVLEL